MFSCTKHVYPFPFSSSVMQSFFSFPVSSLLGTQQQLTHAPVKSSTLPIRKMPVFQGVAPWHTIVTSSCVIPLQDSAAAHSPSGKELNPSSQENALFSGRCIYFYSDLQRSVARDFGGVSQIRLHFPFFVRGRVKHQKEILWFTTRKSLMIA